MGEYILVMGEQVKLGTCESLYYVTHAQLQSWIALGIAGIDRGGASPAEYAKPDSGFRFRFPFPDEDNVELGNVADFDRGFTIAAPLGFMDEVDHRDLSLSIDPIGPKGGHHLNTKVPCPHNSTNPNRKIFETSHYPPIKYECIQIVSQKYVQAETSHGEPRLWTCARCAYCGATFRMSPEHALQLIDHEISVYKEIRHTELFKRMMAGYNGPVA